jgi:hypothetical protein
MRMINAMADRMLGAVVPKTEAGACTIIGSWYGVYCYCDYSQQQQWWKQCINSTCGTSCLACYGSVLTCKKPST